MLASSMHVANEQLPRSHNRNKTRHFGTVRPCGSNSAAAYVSIAVAARFTRNGMYVWNESARDRLANF